MKWKRSKKSTPSECHSNNKTTANLNSENHISSKLDNSCRSESLSYDGDSDSEDVDIEEEAEVGGANLIHQNNHVHLDLLTNSLHSLSNRQESLHQNI